MYIQVHHSNNAAYTYIATVQYKMVSMLHALPLSNGIQIVYNKNTEVVLIKFAIITIVIWLLPLQCSGPCNGSGASYSGNHSAIVG